MTRFRSNSHWVLRYFEWARSICFCSRLFAALRFPSSASSASVFAWASSCASFSFSTRRVAMVADLDFSSSLRFFICLSRFLQVLHLLLGVSTDPDRWEFSLSFVLGLWVVCGWGSGGAACEPSSAIWCALLEFVACDSCCECCLVWPLSDCATSTLIPSAEAWSSSVHEEHTNVSRLLCRLMPAHVRWYQFSHAMHSTEPLVAKAWHIGQDG